MTKKRIAEQARLLLGNKPSYQELMLAVNQAFGVVVQKNWWMNKAQGENDINGNFIYSFDNNAIILDVNKNLYYSLLPSSFLGNIPHEMGVPHVSYQQDYNRPFIRLTNGQSALFRGLQSEGMEGNDTFFVENDKVYLPTMTAAKVNALTTPTLLIKLVVALEGVDDETNLAIPPDIEAEIIAMVVQLYSQKQNDTVAQSTSVEEGKKP